MKDIVFFDFFGVISSEVAPFWFERHFPPEEAARHKVDIYGRSDLGIITDEEAFLEIEALTGVPHQTVERQMYELVKIDSRMVEFLKQVRKRYPVYLLSNAPSPFLRNILRDYELYPCFDDVFISCEMKLGKPSREYFEYVLGVLGIDPGRAVMTDDNPRNIAGAASVGIDGIVYSGFEDFRRSFDKYFKTDDINV